MTVGLLSPDLKDTGFIYSDGGIYALDVLGGIWLIWKGIELGVTVAKLILINDSTGEWLDYF